VIKAIEDAKGVLSRAAILLGCSRPTLYTWIYQHGLERKAGICIDTRPALDRRACKDGSSTTTTKPTVKTGASPSPTLRLVQEAATVEVLIPATVRVRESLWKRTKIEAIRKDTTVAALVEEGLERVLADANAQLSEKAKK
jgi:hypothetical protein